MKNKIEVSAIIPTYERKECLKDLLESIFRSNYPRKKMEIIVVDDNSNEPYEEIKEGIPSVKFLKNKESKWASRCRNIGAKVSKGKYLLFIDDDNLLDEGCISEL
ncbi:MAG: glycosyltransferase family 2 protein, partial [Candidatus Aenigmatarchaeota archaeon]